MKRSQINGAIRRAKAMLEENNLRLPEFAYWTMPQWAGRLAGLDNLVHTGLGWDVTDFGGGDFARRGAVLFTIRNGVKGDRSAGTPYAEKLIFQLCESEQEIPFHFHTEKTEDIINRGGGTLMLQLYNATDQDALDEKGQIHIRMDGIDHLLPPGAVVEVAKGGSITLTPRLFHRFWAKKGAGDLVVGEVSSINDDRTDNTFLEPSARFATVQEDEAPLCPLVNEYHLLNAPTA